MTKFILWLVGLGAVLAAIKFIVLALAWIFLASGILGTVRAVVLSKQTVTWLRTGNAVVRSKGLDELFINSASLLALTVSLLILLQ